MPKQAMSAFLLALLLAFSSKFVFADSAMEESDVEATEACITSAASVELLQSKVALEAPKATANPEEVSKMNVTGTAAPVLLEAASEDQLQAVDVVCTFGQKVFLTSYRSLQLSDSTFRMRHEHGYEQKWKLTDAGNGKVFITSYRNLQLSDRHGLELLGDMGYRQKWKFTDAGNGKVFITSYSNLQLTDSHYELVYGSFGYEQKWVVTALDGSSPCQGQSKYKESAKSETACPSQSVKMSESECRQAAIDLGVEFGQASSWNGAPSGCFRFSADNKFYYNSNSGSSQSTSNVVCMSDEACAAGYTPVAGDIRGWGRVNGKGGGQHVSKCSKCADLCSSESSCGSYECSKTTLKCNLNTLSQPTTGSYKDYDFCSRET